MTKPSEPPILELDYDWPDPEPGAKGASHPESATVPIAKPPTPPPAAPTAGASTGKAPNLPPATRGAPATRVGPPPTKPPLPQGGAGSPPPSRVVKPLEAP